MINISVRKVAHIILRARELEVKVGRWDGAGDTADAETILETRRGDATGDELHTFINDLNVDEQIELVAISWIGRETFSADELAEALQTARDERSGPTADYLMGMPLLSEYLESGLEALGIDPSDAEDEIYSHN